MSSKRPQPTTEAQVEAESSLDPHGELARS